MRTSILLLSVLFLVSVSLVELSGQCNNVTLTTQTEVDNFDPGCTGVTGYLKIQTVSGTSDPITNLNSLANVESVGGDLSINQNPQLQDVSGLGSLESVGGNFLISHNAQLEDISGLGNLNSVAQNMYIRENAILETVSGLGSLETVGASLQINDNTQLETVPGLGNMKSIGSQLYIADNPQLVNLLGLDNLESISSYLYIYNNAVLVDLSGLGNLESIGTNLSIAANAELTSLEGLENIDPGSINTLAIEGNPKLTYCSLPNICAYLADPGNPRSISGNLGTCATENDVVDACEPICPNDVTLTTQDEVNEYGLMYSHCTAISGNLTISGNDITDLMPLENLESVGGFVRIDYNTQLDDLSGLGNLETVGGYLFIYENDMLEDVSNLENLKTIGGYLYISYNAQLVDLSGLGSLQSVGGHLTIYENDMLLDLSGLDNLETIGGYLDISYNDMLLDLSGLESLISVDDHLTIYENDMLLDLSGLGSLETINGDLYISYNAQLEDLSGLDNIAPGTITSLYIEDNPNLSYCSLSNICTYLADPDNPRTISGNSGTCVTEADVVNACLPEVVSVSVPGGLIEVCYGTKWEDVYGLPATVEANLESGGTKTVIVNWDKGVYDGEVPGEYEVTGNLVIPPLSDFSNASHIKAKASVHVLPVLGIRSVLNVALGDTLHLVDCLPPDISKGDLDLGPVREGISLSSRVFAAELPADPPFGMWKVQEYTFEVTNRCGQTASFEIYVALYDLVPPVFRNFPDDMTIPTAADLPSVPGDVEIIDICRYVVWDTVTTTAITDPQSGDTLAFVRRWIAEDEVGHKSYRDQVIRVTGTSGPVPEPYEFGLLTARIVKEHDLLSARFPGAEGTSGIPVILYRLDSTGMTAVNSMHSGDWQGQEGTVFFTTLQQGVYRVKVDKPDGYVAVHPDTLVDSTGWSTALDIMGDMKINLGTIVLVPDSTTADTAATVEVLVQTDHPVAQSFDPKNFSLQAYPNPTTRRVKIDISEPGTYEYHLYNRLGQVVHSGILADGAELDLGDRPAGLYYLRVHSDGQAVGTLKVVVSGR